MNLNLPHKKVPAASLGPCAFQNQEKVIESAVLEYLRKKGLPDEQLDHILETVSLLPDYSGLYDLFNLFVD